MSKHTATPGPWRVCGGHTPSHTAIHSAAGYIVWQMADREIHTEGGSIVSAPDYETQRANARLIAAAPALLAAARAAKDELERLMAILGDEDYATAEAVVEQLAAAIKLAEGEA